MSFLRSDRLRDPVADAGAAVSTKGARMARDAHHERLSSLDATFLGVEDRCSHMHIGSVGVSDLRRGDRDVDRTTAPLVASALLAAPRARSS
jgi:hypothetical protein